MTDTGSGQDIKDGVLDLLDGLGNVAPGPASLLMKQAAANARGQRYDATLLDLAGATNITSVPGMAGQEAVANRGHSLAVHLIAKGVGAAWSFKLGFDDVKRQIDHNPDGGPGLDDPEGDGDPDGDGNPNESGPPPPGDTPAQPPYDPEGDGDPDGDGDPNESGPPPPGAPGGGRPGGNGGGGGQPAPFDPLVLDLDGDGVELSSISARNVYFDLDSDGFAEKTGWVQPDDGLLALDRNGNGSIDNGGELFGNATQDGFDILKTLDDNLDGRFDSSDAEFGNVRVWRDLNGDGVSQSAELQTLAQLGVTSISLESSSVGVRNEGNWIARSADVSFADGSTKAVESVYFEADTHLTNYVLPPGFVFAEEAILLPNLKGFGDVPDLAIAISLDPLLLQQLKTLVLNSDGITVAELRAQVEDLVYDWVKVDEKPHSGRGSAVDYDKLAVVEAFGGQPFPAPLLSFGNAKAVAARYESIIDGLTGRLIVQLSASHYALNFAQGIDLPMFGHSLAAYEVFFYDAIADTISGRPELFLAMATDLLEGDRWAQLTELNKLLDFTRTISLVVFNGDRGALDEYLGNVLSDRTNQSDVLTDADVLMARDKKILVGTAAADILQLAAGDMGLNSVFYGLDGNDTLNGGLRNDILDGGSGDDVMYGIAGDDIYMFGIGSGQDIAREYDGFSYGGFDTVQLGEGIAPADITIVQTDNGSDLVIKINGTTDQIVLDNSVIGYGERIEQLRFADGTVWTHAQMLALAIPPTSGDDLFWGGPDNDPLSGGAGNDTLRGRGGNDVLDGGSGNDLLYGVAGDDTYLFGIGSGQDIAREYDGSSYGGFDTVQLGEGVTSADISVVQADNGTDLVVKINGTTDQIVLENNVLGLGERIEQLRFADGSLMTYAQMLALATAPTGGDDLFWGGPDNDPLSGGAGNDILRGRGGNDILDGGSGNDLLEGVAGDDTYLFGIGSGQDIAREYDGYSYGGFDIVQLGAGIGTGDITIVQGDSGRDLIVKINGTTDQIVLDNTILGAGERIEELRFADGTVWSHAHMLVVASGATAGNDTIAGDDGHNNISGGDGNDTLSGRGGNDILTGGNGVDLLKGETGNDVLDGGSGNDIMYGVAGDDTYLFGTGSGQDIAREYDGGSSYGGFDTVQMGDGITSADITVVQADSGRDLIVKINGTTDQIVLDNNVLGLGERIEQLRFADGTLMTYLQMLALATAPTGGADVFWGGPDNDPLSGGAGNDTLNGRGGNDVLDGGSGNDLLYGVAGDDTYLFGIGSGQDIAREYDGSSYGGTDTVQLGAGIGIGDITIVQADSGRDLIVKINGTTDQIVLDNTVVGAGERIELLRFADGTTVLTYAQMLALATTPTAGNDLFYGGPEGDPLSGGAGNDTLYGLAGNDTLDGGIGSDQLEGGAGDDVYLYDPGDGDDVIYDYQGTRNNRIQFGETIAPGDLLFSRVSEDSSDLRITFKNMSGSILIDHQTWTNAGIETFAFADGSTLSEAAANALIIPATNGNDTLSGTAATDQMWGLEGADSLSGLGGSDSLNGQDGADVLFGGSGADLLTGGGGLDIFRFGNGDSGLGAGADRVLDFVSGSDKIDLSPLDADSGSAGDQAFTFIGAAAFSGAAGELRWFDDGTDTWLQADVNGDGAADFEIVLAGIVTPLVSDFTF